MKTDGIAALRGKEILKAADIAAAWEVPISAGYKIIREIRSKHDSLHQTGRVHIGDYCRYFSVNIADYR